MQQEKESISRNAGGIWMRTVRQLLVHNNHLTEGRRRHPGCGVCQKGLAELAEEYEKAGIWTVVQNDRVDKERAAPLAHTDGLPEPEYEDDPLRLAFGIVSSDERGIVRDVGGTGNE